jgi:uncharacterized protein (DUF924 family)
MTRFPFAEAIRRFWFADALAGAAQARARTKAWFRSDPRFDAELGQRFGDCPDRAVHGEFDAWIDEPIAAAVRILVLDQFPRNLFRDTAQAFAYDPLAQAAAKALVEGGRDSGLHPLLAVFVYLPFEHAEDRGLQAQAVQCFESLEARADAELQEIFRGFTDYARRHQAVIRRFGRFPHRNAILGRASTPEELKYLASGGERFGSSQIEDPSQDR